ncbi:DeoR/GlpR family DNA-binding transcription regulator [Pokkaliibacter sp. CJK22405]|uniref:DeoR/GlpR family DNA-binding transcription regulator n=1 Tax=Pokkaliibacter sp. CJK22405 TaxID=3384615 RepID=UPI0039854FAB
MKRDERQQAIMDLLVEHGAVDLEELSQRFEVTRMTVHRDLDELEQSGLLRKVRGGATIEAGTQFESDFRFREKKDTGAKEAMATRALELIEPGMTVMVNDGSMAAVLGEKLKEKRPLTVITNNAAVIDCLKAETGIRLIALGGAYSAKYNGFFGVVTEASLRQLRADVAFLSSPAVSGTSVFHMDDEVVRAKRAMMASAARTCLLINHNRFGRTALHVLADLSEFDTVITDKAPADDARAALEKAGIELTLCQ